MDTEEGPGWLVELYEEQGATLHRLVVLLGAEQQSGRIVRGALLALERRGHRLIDPGERVEFLQENVVHAARAVRPVQAPLTMPQVDDEHQLAILEQVSRLPARMAEILVVSHYLSVFGPELAGVMRLPVRGCNQRLEIARETLRANLGMEARPGGLEALSQEVTAALRAGARTVQAPGTATLATELAQLDGSTKITIGARSVAVLTALAIVVGLVLAAIMNPAAKPLDPPPPTKVATVAPTAELSMPAQVRGIALYYVGREDRRLYRELRDLTSSGDLVRSAVSALLTVPPNDPDYESMWGAGQLIRIEQTDVELLIDLSAAAYDAITGTGNEELARDQIVYTVSHLVADPYLSVVFLSDGGPPPASFAAEGGYRRQDLAPMPPVWITAPANQAKLAAGEITVSGLVKPGVGEPQIRIKNTDSGVLLFDEPAAVSGRVTDEGWQAWTINHALPAGRYEVSVRTPGEPGGKASLETKSFEVG